MSNNCLYILDEETGERKFVAKSFGDGWDWRTSAFDLSDWLEFRDQAASYGNALASSRLRFVTDNDREDS